MVVAMMGVMVTMVRALVMSLSEIIIIAMMNLTRMEILRLQLVMVLMLPVMPN